eukprot:Gregarina_sp_Pseudo_9__1650@NODE_210_length_3605_cov_331_563376_g195_i0_p3_GENE_NODE_210_length_3605_cov_331_563376_g195_i0NODE_210_length_3605_cov_331_563376_g195_i0_p3_ORF_typecomplete_len231_score52_32_NODE_210_length_3605_cov_331_563376_g195_i016842376
MRLVSALALFSVTDGVAMRRLSQWEVLTPNDEECQIPACDNPQSEMDAIVCQISTSHCERRRIATPSVTENNARADTSLIRRVPIKVAYFPPPFYPLPRYWRMDTSLVVPENNPLFVISINRPSGFRVAHALQDKQRKCGWRPNLGQVWRSAQRVLHSNFSVNAFHRFVHNPRMALLLPLSEEKPYIEFVYGGIDRNVTILGTKTLQDASPSFAFLATKLLVKLFQTLSG